jgi:luciferase-type oxidoreductase
VLGVASGDRPVEFPAFRVDADARGAAFSENLLAMRRMLGEAFPALHGTYGDVVGADVVPKPIADGIPVLVTGNSRQTLDWIALHADGWLTYPRALEAQQRVVANWRSSTARLRPDEFLPFAQSLYIDLAEDPAHSPESIHLGWRIGRHPLVNLIGELEASGVNHIVLNLKYGRRPADEVLAELIEFIVPEFPSHAALNDRLLEGCV